jgi:vanillate O-demethylase ferredoxin subunit
MTVTTNQTVREVLNQITHDPRYKSVMFMKTVDVPQTLLTVVTLATFTLSTLWYLNGIIPWWLAVAFNIFAVYLAVKPMHYA